MIEGCTDAAKGDITIPDKINNMRVLKIAENAFKENKKIAKVTIPASIGTIGAFAFADTSINEVIFNKTDFGVSIGKEAFGQCNNLIKVIVNRPLDNISESMFQECRKLTTLNLQYPVANIHKYAFFNCTSIKYIDFKGNVKYIGTDAFRDCTSLQTVNIAGEKSCSEMQYASEIGKNAFCNCTSLDSIMIPGSVETIKENAFENCTNLLSLRIEKGVKNIEKNAFINCSKLSTAQIAGNIDEDSFSKCPNIRYLTVVSGKIDNKAFAFRNKLIEVDIKSDVESVGEEAFIFCDNLRKVTVSAKKIENSAFSLCRNLETAIITKDVESIVNNAFLGSDKVRIHVYKDSVAEKYVRKNNLKYIVVDVKPIVSAKINNTQRQLTYSINSNTSSGLKSYSVKSPSGKILARGNYSTSKHKTSVSGTIKISESGTYTVYAKNQNDKESFLEKSCNLKSNSSSNSSSGGSTSGSSNSGNNNSQTQVSSQTEYEKAYKNKGHITDFTYGAPQQQAPTLSADKNNAKLYIKVLDSDITSIAKFIVQRKESGKWKTIIDSKQALGAKCIQNMYSLNTVFGNNSKINYRILIYYIKNGTKYRYYTDEKTLSNPKPTNNANSSGNSNNNNKPQTVKITKPTISTFKIEKQTASEATLRISGNMGTYGIKYYIVSTSPTYGGRAYYIAQDHSTTYKSVNFTENITKNGTYYLYLVDSKGNYTRSNAITVNSIDSTPPEIENIKLSTTAPAQKVTLRFKCSDSGAGVRSYAITTEPNYQNVKFYYINNDKSISKSKTMSETITKNGTYYIYVKDNNDNIAKSNGITIKNIDTIKPYFKSFKVISTNHVKNGNYRYITSQNAKKNHVTMQIITNEKVTIDKSKIILSGSGASKSKVQFTKINDTTYNVTITAGSSNGKVSFYFAEGFLKDTVGNVSKKGTNTYSSIYVYNTAPTAKGKVTQNGSETTVNASITGGIGQVYYKWIKGNDIKNPIQEGQFRKYTEPIKLVTRTGEMITLITKDSLGNEKYYYYYPEVQFSTRNVMSGETYYKQTGNLNLNNVGDRVTYKIVSNVKTKLYDDYIKNIKLEGKSTEGITTKLEKYGTSDRAYLLTLERTSGNGINTGDLKVIIPQGTIYLRDPHSSAEKELQIKVDNTAPTVDVGTIKDGKINFHLTDGSNSGIKKYVLQRIGGGTSKKNFTTPIKSDYVFTYGPKNPGEYTITVVDASGNKTVKSFRVEREDLI